VRKSEGVGKGKREEGEKGMEREKGKDGEGEVGLRIFRVCSLDCCAREERIENEWIWNLEKKSGNLDR